MSNVLPDPAVEPTITVERAGQLLGVGRALAYRLAASGDLPVIRLGSRLRVPTQPLLDLLGLSATSH